MPERESLREKELAQVANINIATEIAKLQMAGVLLDLQCKKDAIARDRACDYYHCVYNFSDVVDGRSVGACLDVLSTWSRLWPEKPMEIIFHSPGGLLMPGLALFDYIGRLGQNGHHITTLALGYAASMAGILLQAGNTRLIGRESYVLIHEIESSAVGKLGEIEDTVTFLNKAQDRIIDVFVRRSKGKISRPTFIKHWKRQAWWLDSEEMVKWGFVDGVR